MNETYCQSCGIPLTDELFGTNADNSKNQDYCSYCYQGGQFTANCTMEEMIEFCISPMVDATPDMTPEKARSAMRQWFPLLKRWKK